MTTEADFAIINAAEENRKGVTPMDKYIYRNFVDILKKELIAALGCTEPIAIAFAAAKARQALDGMPTKVIVHCSGNIVKNVKSVTVPNSGGMTGIEIAAILGIVGGDADAQLEVLSGVTDAHRQQARDLLKQGFCTCKLQEGVDNLYVDVYVQNAEHSAQVTVMNRHTLITRIIRDGELLYKQDIVDQAKSGDNSLLSMDGILEFADCVEMDDIREIIGRQIEMNSAISREGLSEKYGAQIGNVLLKSFGSDVRVRAMAAAAAGSDARMSGCAMPVVINSGSGNQGMTVSLPVLEYAKELNCTQEKTYRALVISNLISVHIKKYIGDLSAFCGAVSAACGAGAAITYLHDGTPQQIANTVINTVANVGGILCDGAKASCAAKIASAVNAAILGHAMSMAGIVFHNDEGIVGQDVESTIRSIGHIGQVGMAKTDLEILKIMMKEVSF